jgi:hypothetical protein
MGNDRLILIVLEAAESTDGVPYEPLIEALKVLSAVKE